MSIGYQYLVDRYINKIKVAEDGQFYDSLRYTRYDSWSDAHYAMLARTQALITEHESEIRRLKNTIKRIHKMTESMAEKAAKDKP